VNQRRLWATYLSLLLLLALALSACAPAAPATESGDSGEGDAAADSASAEEADGEKQIIYALYQEPELLNPFIATQTAAAETYQFVIEGLLGVNPDGDRFAVLAQEVPTVDNGQVSEDGLTVTYNLKEGVVWSDGEKMISPLWSSLQNSMHPIWLSSAKLCQAMPLAKLPIWSTGNIIGCHWEPAPL